MRKGPVIAISGYSGAGKTTLSLLLAKELSATVVAYDAYQTMTARPVSQTLDWIARGQDYSEIEAPGLVEAIEETCNSGAVVFDTPLGRAHPLTGKLIDLSVWIDCPADLALSRKLAQIREQQSPADFSQWLQGYLAMYQPLILPSRIAQEARVKPLADIKLAAELTLNQSVELLLSKFASLTRG